MKEQGNNGQKSILDFVAGEDTLVYEFIPEKDLTMTIPLVDDKELVDDKKKETTLNNSREEK